tara:strand:+ start:5964 stop:6542 length:579 start_codon:yes stop_codon:yes gene_type:complete
MYQYRIPELMKVRTVDWWGYKVDTEIQKSFSGTVRRFAKRHDDRVRVERSTLNYYTSDLDNIDQVIQYVNRINNKESDITDTTLELASVRYFPGTITQTNIHYRKKRLPYNKFKFQILGERMTFEQYTDWANWAKQYPKDIRLTHSDNIRRWGTWCGENIGYITSDKLLQLVQFKLGSNINKIIEYQIRETK